jgi:phosphatidylserine decarboxylase
MKRRNSPIVLEGFIFILPLLVLTVIFISVGIKSLAVLFLVLTLFVTNFFRNPERTIPTDTNAVVSPADGRVLKIEDVEGNGLITGKCKKVSIFMNVFNVHVNRTPYTGTVKTIRYEEGKFFNASLDKASSLNEKNSVLVQTSDGREILTVQIAGLVARRIVCWVKEGMNIERGERFGLIRFGSRLEVFMPVDTEILVSVGDKVRAGETKIGSLQ